MATPQKPGRPQDRQDDQYQRDLNPDPTAGLNIGAAGEQPGRYARTAAKIADIDEYLPGCSKDDLSRLPVLQPGTRLEQGARYINLKDPARQEFTGMAHDAVGEDDYIIPKSQVGYDLWNRLMGITDPTRTTGP